MNEYISREFMLKNLEADKMNNAEHCDPVTVQIMERFIRYVKEFPAEDIQSEKCGKWDNGHCSSCGEDIASRLDTWTNVQSFKFCPNCGARMDGE